MMAETGCDGVMIGRAATKNPWIFRQIEARLSGGRVQEPNLEDRRQLILGHFRLVAERENERFALHKLRKFTGWYTHGLPHGRKLRQQDQPTPRCRELPRCGRGVLRSPGGASCLMKPLCYLGGRIQPLAEARLDPLDRGNLFGDALYEGGQSPRRAVLLAPGAPPRSDLRPACDAWRFPYPTLFPRSVTTWHGSRSCRTGYLYIQVSRGVSSRILIPPRDLEPTLLVVPFRAAVRPTRRQISSGPSRSPTGDGISATSRPPA